jgi:putative transposase
VIDYIACYRDRFGVEPICAVLSEHGVPIAPSTFYEHAGRRFGPSQAELADAYAANTLYQLWARERRVYGQRKLWHAARRAGHGWGRDQVTRLMRMAGIEGVRRGARTTVTTRRDEQAPRHPDHINRAWRSCTRPDQWWVADFTYVWTAAGFCYVSFVTDCYSRRILGWRVSPSKTTPLVLSALEQALATRRRTSFSFTADGLIHHSDAGSQYTSLVFTEALRDAGITGSIGSVGDALDNALIESTIGLFKTEVIDLEHRSWTSWRQVEQAVAAWVHWFNHSRLHSSIGHIPPIEYETAYHEATTGPGTPVAA